MLRLRMLHKKGFFVLWDFPETGQFPSQPTTHFWPILTCVDMLHTRIFFGVVHEAQNNSKRDHVPFSHVLDTLTHIFRIHMSALLLL